MINIIEKAKSNLDEFNQFLIDDNETRKQKIKQYFYNNRKLYFYLTIIGICLAILATDLIKINNNQKGGADEAGKPKEPNNRNNNNENRGRKENNQKELYSNLPPETAKPNFNTLKNNPDGNKPNSNKPKQPEQNFIKPKQQILVDKPNNKPNKLEFKQESNTTINLGENTGKDKGKTFSFDKGNKDKGENKKGKKSKSSASADLSYEMRTKSPKEFLKHRILGNVNKVIFFLYNKLKGVVVFLSLFALAGFAILIPPLIYLYVIFLMFKFLIGKGMKF